MALLPCLLQPDLARVQVTLCCVRWAACAASDLRALPRRALPCICQPYVAGCVAALRLCLAPGLTRAPHIR